MVPFRKAHTLPLSAEDEPPAEYAFAVQYPKVETQEEKSQRVNQLLDNILPGGQQPPPADSASATTDREATEPAEAAKPEETMRTPVPAGQREGCYDGAWQENESNQFVWNFRRYGSTLRIVRNDRFVKGEFQKTSDGWIGFLSWGNGTVWRGVVLHEANDSCDEITTNQQWWYRR